MSAHSTGYRPKVYLAAPLFSDAERTFNSCLAGKLEAWLDVYLPQRDGGLMSEMLRSGLSIDVAASRVFRRDLDAIRQSHFLIAVLDGRTIDEGVAFELGIAFSSAKRCIGLQTDSRRLASWGNNPMISGALETVFSSSERLLAWIAIAVSDVSALEHNKSGIGTPVQQPFRESKHG
jgi:nucleoside 2-deoxyribosyltransferase